MKMKNHQNENFDMTEILGLRASHFPNSDVKAGICSSTVCTLGCFPEAELVKDFPTVPLKFCSNSKINVATSKSFIDGCASQQPNPKCLPLY